MTHYTDFYLKNGERERISWAHDPDPYEIICYMGDRFGGADNVFTQDTFNGSEPDYFALVFDGYNWIDNPEKQQRSHNL